MPQTKSRLPWTHYHVSAKSGVITGFSLDACENCGGPIQAANSITLVETPERLDSLGLTRAETLPPEGYYSDEAEGEACYGCNG